MTSAAPGEVHSKEDWDCIEGLLSEKALLERCGERQLVDVPSDHVVWKTVAEYLGRYLCIAITTLIAPDIIVIGGWTMIDGDGKFRRPVMQGTREAFRTAIGDYPRYEQLGVSRAWFFVPRYQVSLSGVEVPVRRRFSPGPDGLRSCRGRCSHGLVP
jgi:predicted NBD/HSP70 family sugar kinase